MSKPLPFFILLTFPITLLGGKTAFLSHSTMDDFIDGQVNNFSIIHDEGLRSGSSLTELTTLPGDIVFDAKEDSSGLLYISMGSPGEVLSLTRESEPKSVFKTDDLFARAIAIDKDDQLFVATSPSGKVYKKNKDGTIHLFFSPEAKYIWDIEFLPTGELLVATGEPAQLYKLPADYKFEDEISPIFSFTQKHFTKINTNLEHSILLGTSPDALLFQLSLDGQIERTINAQGTEVTQIIPTEQGIYFSSISAKAPKPKPSRIPLTKQVPKPKDSIFLWKDNGFLSTIWQDEDRPIFTFNQREEEFLIGSGSEGHIFTTTGSTDWGTWNQIAKGGDINVIHSSSSTPGSLYIFSSNPAAVYLHDQDNSSPSKYTSEVIDAGQIVSWGKLHLAGQLIDEAENLVRFGNTQKPDSSWTAWRTEDLSNPANFQYAQYQITTASTNVQIALVKWYYRLANQAPEIGTINILPISVDSVTVSKKPEELLDVKKLFEGKPLDEVLITPNPFRQKFILENEKNHITVSWQARDMNDDTLVFDLYLQEVGKEEWIAIEKDLTMPLYSFSTNGMTPAFYRVKIVASDKYSNTTEEALSLEKVSKQFVIDNTKPTITFHGSSSTNDGEYTLSFEVKDDFSVIEEARILLNGDTEYTLIPDDGFFDQTSEKFSLKLRDLSIGIQSLIFQVKDESRNLSVYQTTFTTE